MSSRAIVLSLEFKIYFEIGSILATLLKKHIAQFSRKGADMMIIKTCRAGSRLDIRTQITQGRMFDVVEQVVDADLIGIGSPLPSLLCKDFVF